VVLDPPKYLVSVCAHGDTKRPRKSKISQLQVVMFIDEKVRRVEFSMKDPVGMAIQEASDELFCKFLQRLSTTARDH